MYKLFKQNEATPIDFKGEVKADELSQFVQTNARLWIGMFFFFIFCLMSLLPPLQMLFRFITQSFLPTLGSKDCVTSQKSIREGDYSVE